MTGAGSGVASPVTVVGLHGGEWFGARAGAALTGAQVVVGAPRHLDAVAASLDPAAVTRPLAGALDEVVAGVVADAAAGRRVCVLASGDPGFFGVVRALAAGLGARPGDGRLAVHPAPSSVALAFARLGRSWDDAAVVSAHGRPLAGAVAAVTAALRAGAGAVAVLTAPDAPPAAVAAALIAAGVDPATSAAVATALGAGPSESVEVADLRAVAAGGAGPLSVLVVLAGSPSAPSAAWPTPGAAPVEGWALDERRFAHRAGMITKAEVRAVVLARLALPATGVLWDVGAGSGSVAVECARLAPGLRVVAVERDPEAAGRVRANAAAFGVAVDVVEGAAPDALTGLPDPDRVFVGGGGPVVLDAACDRLAPGGRAVATFAVIDSALHAGRRLGNLVQLAASRGVPTGDVGLRLRAENPVFVCWGPGDD
ncbi:MAG TPA: precorrin-6y C5,15-methyltransferase (decarboxylating) subunit CbiE [Acidimicrobiales bacterium]|nr:precorrin-6y C5,15-methyltransferase (decarboxylating) subunit CbiE [Acidimicrobiales bacterium]